MVTLVGVVPRKISICKISDVQSLSKGRSRLDPAAQPWGESGKRPNIQGNIEGKWRDYPRVLSVGWGFAEITREQQAGFHPVDVALTKYSLLGSYWKRATHTADLRS